MDFSWTEEQDEIYKSILQYAREASRADGMEYWTRTQWQRCGESGLLGLSVPQRYQGKGLGALSTARALEAFSYGYEDMCLVFSAAAHLFACCMPVVEHGSEEMKQRLLPALCSGQSIGANEL